MLKEFKAFVMRGNVLDLAVGIIIGGAFGTIVKSLVDDVIMPPIGLALGNVDFSNLFVLLKAGAKAPPPYRHARRSQGGGRRHHQLRPVRQQHHHLPHRRLCGVPDRARGQPAEAAEAGGRADHQGLPVLQDADPAGRHPVPPVHLRAQGGLTWITHSPRRRSPWMGTALPRRSASSAVSRFARATSSGPSAARSRPCSAATSRCSPSCARRPAQEAFEMMVEHAEAAGRQRDHRRALRCDRADAGRDRGALLRHGRGGGR